MHVSGNFTAPPPPNFPPIPGEPPPPLPLPPPHPPHPETYKLLKHGKEVTVRGNPTLKFRRLVTLSPSGGRI